MEKDGFSPRREAPPPPYSLPLLPPYKELISAPSAPPIESEEGYLNNNEKNSVIKKHFTLKIVLILLLVLYMLEWGASIYFFKRDDWLYRCLTLFGEGNNYSSSNFWIVLYFILKGCCIVCAFVGLFGKYAYLLIPMLMYLASWILTGLVIIIYLSVRVNNTSDTDQQRLLLALGERNNFEGEISKLVWTMIVSFGFWTLIDIGIVTLFGLQLYRKWSRRF